MYWSITLAIFYLQAFDRRQDLAHLVRRGLTAGALDIYSRIAVRGRLVHTVTGPGLSRLSEIGSAALTTVGKRKSFRGLAHFGQDVEDRCHCEMVSVSVPDENLAQDRRGDV